MIKFSILASGSSGNAAVICSDEAVVLIDCGVSAKYLSESLAAINIKPQDISAAVITHAHGDHISASGLSFLMKHNVKILSCGEVFEDAFIKHGVKLDDCRLIAFVRNFKVYDIEVNPFYVHHRDQRVSKTLGFTFVSQSCGKQYKIGYVTDTGKICKNIVSHLADSNILAIESNYDTAMLEESLRPYENKQWILSDNGHLSNAAAAQAIIDVKNASKAKDSLKYVFLAHISQSHNSKRLALSTVENALAKNKITDINLFTALRHSKSKTIIIQ
ncbi:MAG: MBL fold metallo-hydrolase [Endomicrobium sp.]|nr:MBL fold metallo-hydrolase [Endomicrobium sp.]